MCLGLLALVPNVESGDSGITKICHEGYATPDVVIGNTSDTGTIPYNLLINICNTSIEQNRYLIAIGCYDLDTNEISKMTFNITPQTVHTAGNISIHALYHPWGGRFVPWQSNWTIAGTSPISKSWNSPGGDYVQTPYDTKYIDTGGITYTFNITPYLSRDVENQIGLILIAEYGCNISFVGGSSRAWYIFYISGSGTSTNLVKDVWNLKGFNNATSKLASTIYSEITNCKALSWKNATSGYYYTYWPEYGMLEDEYLSFGDGLFILTSQNTTWDHT